MSDLYSYSIFTPVLNYGSVVNFVGDWSLAGRTGFASLYSVTETDAKAVQSTGVKECT